MSAAEVVFLTEFVISAHFAQQYLAYHGTYYIKNSQSNTFETAFLNK